MRKAHLRTRSPLTQPLSIMNTKQTKTAEVPSSIRQSQLCHYQAASSTNHLTPNGMENHTRQKYNHTPSRRGTPSPPDNVSRVSHTPKGLARHTGGLFESEALSDPWLSSSSSPAPARLMVRPTFSGSGKTLGQLKTGSLRPQPRSARPTPAH